jgi:tripartite-type tricarboxylate transporter receptor subunit TctC
LAGLSALATAGAPRHACASAEAWPTRRVRLIVPAAPGSSLDLETRLLAEGLAARWGQPVVVESHQGADGIPAMQAMLAVPPGEALFSTNHGVITVTPILHPQLGFEPMAEFAPIVDLTADQFGVTVPANLPARDLAGLIALARKRPGTLNYTAAPGPPYLAMRAFLRDAGAEMTFIGYRGMGAAVIGELLAGRLQAMMSPLSPVVGSVRDGKLRLIAVTGAERAPAAPEVPTSTEQGFPDFRQEGIHGLFGWKGMPSGLQAHIATEALGVIAEPVTAERLRLAGQLVRRGGSPASFAAVLAEQRQHWAVLAREFGANPG